MPLFWGAIFLEKSTSNSSIIWWHSSPEISALFIFYKFRVFMVEKLSGLGVFQQKGSACLRSASAKNNLTFRKLTVKKNKNIMSHSLDPPARYSHHPKNFTFWVHFRSQGRQFSWRVRRVR